MTVTVTNLFFEKKKEKKRERGEKAAYSIVEVPSQKIAYLDNNGVVSTLARISAGRVKHITKQWLTACLLGCLAACQELWSCHELPCCYLSGERKGDRDTHHHLAPHRHKHWCEWLVTASLIPPADISPMIPPLKVRRVWCRSTTWQQHGCGCRGDENEDIKVWLA